MIKSNMKKGYILLLTSLVSIFIIMSIGTYYKYTSSISLLEFHKDLAKIRGYWAVYGAKELEAEPVYEYYRFNNNSLIYKIETTKDIRSIPIIGTIYKAQYDWVITNTQNSGIKNEMLYNRTLKLFIDGGEIDSNKTRAYLD